MSQQNINRIGEGSPRADVSPAVITQNPGDHLRDIPNERLQSLGAGVLGLIGSTSPDMLSGYLPYQADREPVILPAGTVNTGTLKPHDIGYSDRGDGYDAVLR